MFMHGYGLTGQAGFVHLLFLHSCEPDIGWNAITGFDNDDVPGHDVD